eukprot:55505_1
MLNALFYWLPIAPVLAFLCFGIYGNVKAYQRRNHITFKKRPMSFGLNCVIIISNILIVLFYMSGTIVDSAPMFTITAALWFITWFIIFTMLNVMNWMIYFRYKWTYYTMQLQWQQIINPNIAQSMKDDNWYIKNNKKYGNKSYVLRLFSVIHFILCMIAICFMVIRTAKENNGELSTITTMLGMALLVLIFIPAIIYLVIVIKTPSFNDIFSIHRESKMQSKACFIVAVSYLIINLTKSFTTSHFIVCLVAIFTVPYPMLTMLYISTFKVISMNTKYNDNVYHLGVDIDNKIQEITLQKLILNDESLHLFMIHLSKEFSMECMLSFIEMVQFKWYVMQKMDISKDKNATYAESMLNFSPNTPTSIIIETNDDNKDMLWNAKFKAYKLYIKYIQPGTEFEINISGVHRQVYINNFDVKSKWMNNNDITEEDLFALFDILIGEMEQLLHLSLTRFRAEPEYEQILANHSVLPTQVIIEQPTSKTNVTALTQNEGEINS